MLILSTKFDWWTMSTKINLEIAQNLDRLMRRIHAGLNATAEDFDTYQVGPAGGMLLLTLADMAPVQAKDLVAALQRDKSQLARSLAALEKKGLIVREPDPNDGRATQLSLTKEGASFAKRLNLAVANVLEEILTPFSAKDLQSFKSLLRKL